MVIKLSFLAKARKGSFHFPYFSGYCSASVFCPPPPEEHILHALDVRRALLFYLDHTKWFHQADNLLVYFAEPRRSAPLPLKMVSAIKLAYCPRLTACSQLRHTQPELRHPLLPSWERFPFGDGVRYKFNKIKTKSARSRFVK